MGGKNEEKNFQSLRANFSLKKNGKLISFIQPGKNFYPVSKMITTEAGIYHDWFKDVYLKYEKLPMGRYGHPNDVAGAVYFFCSDDSKYVTGQTLLVDGGVSVTF